MLASGLGETRSGQGRTPRTHPLQRSIRNAKGQCRQKRKQRIFKIGSFQRPVRLQTHGADHDFFFHFVHHVHSPL